MINNINNKNIIISGGIILIIILGIIFLFKKDKVFTDNAYLKANITIIRPKVTGYITDILVSDNQAIKQGQIIAKIDDRDYKLKVMLEEAKVDATRAKINTITQQLNIKDLEISKASLKKDSARVSFEVADNDLKRAKALIKDKAISQQDLEKKRDLQNSLRNEYGSADSNYKSAFLDKEITLSELNEANALLKNAQASLELAKLDLENTTIKASENGVVSRRSLQIGQLASPQLALAYLVQGDVWVLANFKETQIGKMKTGQHAEVSVDSISGIKFKAKVDSLSPATGSEFSILPPENATGNFTKIVQRVPVKIIFDDNQDLSLLKSGLSCEVKVELE